MVHVFVLLILQNPSAEYAKITRVLDLALSEGYAVAGDFVESEYGRTPYDWGMGIASEHPKTATTWFKGLYAFTDDEQYLYGIAWSRFLDHDSSGALKAVGTLTESTNMLMRAQAFEVMGFISEREGDTDMAVKWLQRAISLYEEQGSVDEVYTSKVHLARMMITANRYDSARCFIDEASSAYARLSSPAPAPLLEVRCVLALASEQYENASLWATRAKHDEDLEVATLGKAFHALSLAFLGETPEADRVMAEVEKSDHRPPLVSAIVALAWARIAQWRGFAHDVFLRDYLKWEEESGDHLLAPIAQVIRSKPGQK